MPKLQAKVRGPLKISICQCILCFVDRASLYNLVNKTNLVCNLFLVHLSIYMFRATMGPSPRETTAFLRHLVFIILCGAYAPAYQTVIHTEQ